LEYSASGFHIIWQLMSRKQKWNSMVQEVTNI
jgi:hypothetical protein